MKKNLKISIHKFIINQIFEFVERNRFQDQQTMMARQTKQKKIELESERAKKTIIIID